MMFAGNLLAQSSQPLSPDDLVAMREQIAQLQHSIAQQQIVLTSLEEKLSGKTAAANPSPQLGGVATSPLQPEAEEQPSDITTPSSVGPNDPQPEIEHKPLDISGYLSSRWTRLAGASEEPTFQQQTVSLFLDKTFGRVQFHSELEYQFAPDRSPAGLPVGLASGDFSAETAWVDYRQQDWLVGRAGIMLTPTYWALHHYPSTALTVQNPLVHERIFPANIVGAMLHGSHYFEEGGFEYSLYTGKAIRFGTPEDQRNDGRGALGGTFLVHIPSKQFFRTLDAGVQLYRDKPGPGLRQNILGWQTQIEKGRFELIGELASGNVRSARGERILFRDGYYLQPAWFLYRGLHLYYRYDWLKFDSRDANHPFADENTVGLNYRPAPSLSLKLEWNTARPNGSESFLHQGFGAGLAYFFQ
jgi:hypothetical protein